tara:strand:- start:1663 stop:1887 length:225 start_codon:yes stop_codon:yes gene_type:complete
MSWEHIIKEDEKPRADRLEEIYRMNRLKTKLNVMIDKIVFKHHHRIEDEGETMSEIIDQMEDYLSSVWEKVRKM